MWRLKRPSSVIHAKLVGERDWWNGKLCEAATDGILNEIKLVRLPRIN